MRINESSIFARMNRQQPRENRNFHPPKIVSSINRKMKMESAIFKEVSYPTEEMKIRLDERDPESEGFTNYDRFELSLNWMKKGYSHATNSIEAFEKRIEERDGLVVTLAQEKEKLRAMEEIPNTIENTIDNYYAKEQMKQNIERYQNDLDKTNASIKLFLERPSEDHESKMILTRQDENGDYFTRFANISTFNPHDIKLTESNYVDVMSNYRDGIGEMLAVVDKVENHLKSKGITMEEFLNNLDKYADIIPSFEESLLDAFVSIFTTGAASSNGKLDTFA